MRPDLICRDCVDKGDGRVKCWRTTVQGDYFHRANQQGKHTYRKTGHDVLSTEKERRNKL